jgi:hypothetical protein
LKPFAILKQYPGSIDQIVDLINDRVVRVLEVKMKRWFMTQTSNLPAAERKKETSELEPKQHAAFRLHKKRHAPFYTTFVCTSNSHTLMLLHLVNVH